jgi:hypothetical protein
MSFLAPLFLAGAIAIALPVIFHLIRRTPRERTIFSSLMFLMATPPRLTRRSRLEHLLLLALRCLALCLLAFGFARPFLPGAVRDESPSAAAHIVVLVDTSASMRRANLWADARDRVEAVLRQASPSDQVALFTFDRGLHPLMTFEQWTASPVGDRAALAARRLADISPGWSSTQLGDALIHAAEILADTEGKSPAARRQIIAITDFQEGSHPDSLQGYEWPKGIQLSIEPLRARHADNAGIQLVTDFDDTARKADATARVRVSNATDSKRDQFKVGWARPNENNFAGATMDVYVPPGQSRIIAVPPLAGGIKSDRIILKGDDEDFDNVVFTIPPTVARLNVLYFGNEAEGESRQPLYFLQRAFQETRRQVVQVLRRPDGSVVPASEMQNAALLIVTDSLSDDRARALHDQVADGKTLLFVVRNESVAPTLARLAGINSLAIEQGRPDNYAMFAEIDFRHPLFAPFADPRFSDFTKIHFWKYRRVSAAALPGARVVAKFDNGDPALLDMPVGKGRILILTSGWQPEDSQLALSTKFVPLLYSTLDYSGAAAPPPQQFAVGDVVPLAPVLGVETLPASIRTPDGSEIKLAAGETNFSQTTMPGIYTAVFTSTQSSSGFAVNLDAAESRTAPLSTDELERLGAPMTPPATMTTRTSEQKVRLQNSELENRQKLWRWFLLAALAVLLLETWLAGRTARRSARPIGETAAMEA